MKVLLKIPVFSLLAFACLSHTARSAEATPTRPPASWEKWAEWVERSYPITDPQGHGPDIGGDEWSQAVNKRLQISDAAGHGPDIGSEEWKKAVEKKLVKEPATSREKRELLSSHRTESRFEGIQDHRCRGMTALCPDACGESGKLATFTIIQYLDYQKPGEYGDPKQTRFQVLIEDNHQIRKVPETIRATILALKPGDRVRLDWNHDYVTRDGSKFPQRLILALSKIPAQP